MSNSVFLCQFKIFVERPYSLKNNTYVKKYTIQTTIEFQKLEILMKLVTKNLCSFAKVGFVGLGNMGFPMAINLAKRGHEVFAFDINPAKAVQAEHNNIVFRNSLKQLAKDAETFVTIVPKSEHSQSVCQSEEGLFKHAAPGSLVIDSSTISPKVSAYLGESAKKHGMTYVDAPVAGGVTGSVAGTLTFMLGAETPEIFNRAKTILEAMGINFFNCGKPGAGQVAKICNNMALAIELNAVGQALALGNDCGLDVKTLSNIMRVSSSRCWALENYNPIPGVMENVPASRDYDKGFDCVLMLKDMVLASELAGQVGSHLNLGDKAREVYEKMTKIGYAKKDMSSVYDALLKHKI